MVAGAIIAIIIKKNGEETVQKKEQVNHAST